MKTKELLKKLTQTKPLNFIFLPIKALYDFYRYRLLSERYVVSINFKKYFGFYPNLKNPQTFNEKLQWLKLYDRTPLHTICADKFKVREYVKNKIGEQYLIPLAFETKKVSDLTAEKLPDYPLIIKANHDSSGGIIIRDKNEHNFKEIQQKLKKLLTRNYYYYHKEWQYKDIEPRVVVEKLLIAEDGGIPYDYKIHCFNGKPKFIQVDVDRMISHKRVLYTTDWEKMDVQYLYPIGPDVQKPTELEAMLKIAAKLSEDFHFARIDLYTVNQDIYFGEITFTPESGYGFFKPNSFDLEAGKWLTLPI